MSPFCTYNLHVKNGLIGIPDALAVALKIEDKVRNARYKIRDEKTMTTWVFDRLLGLNYETY